MCRVKFFSRLWSAWNCFSFFQCNGGTFLIGLYAVKTDPLLRDECPEGYPTPSPNDFSKNLQGDWSHLILNISSPDWGLQDYTAHCYDNFSPGTSGVTCHLHPCQPVLPSLSSCFLLLSILNARLSNHQFLSLLPCPCYPVLPPQCWPLRASDVPTGYATMS